MATSKKDPPSRDRGARMSPSLRPSSSESSSGYGVRRTRSVPSSPDRKFGSSVVNGGGAGLRLLVPLVVAITLRPVGVIAVRVKLWFVRSWQQNPVLPKAHTCQGEIREDRRHPCLAAASGAGRAGKQFVQGHGQDSGIIEVPVHLAEEQTVSKA
ncbi:hypothetical protein GUJ93_ZPchr0004g39043 [Zizania palustris]|uniref:Uncharacterized protein n=1 Tax=Zizania palustris TaxID=103762 RepID=A0A8J5S9Y7_ZIZPA|nr:hypothetical protein GUJ93_ZPchr0004g39043 [Zizania palustris]